MEKSLRKAPKLPHVPDANCTSLNEPFLLVACPSTNLTQQRRLTLLILLFLVFISFPHWMGNCRNDGVWLQRLSYKRRCGFHLACIICVSPSGRRHVMRTLRQFYGEAHVRRNWGFLPTTSTALPVRWRNHLRGRFFSHSQALGRLTFWLRPHDRPWARPLS